MHGQAVVYCRFYIMLAIALVAGGLPATRRMQDAIYGTLAALEAAARKFFRQPRVYQCIISTATPAMRWTG